MKYMASLNISAANVVRNKGEKNGFTGSRVKQMWGQMLMCVCVRVRVWVRDRSGSTIMRTKWLGSVVKTGLVVTRHTVAPVFCSQLPG